MAVTEHKKRRIGRSKNVYHTRECHDIQSAKSRGANIKDASDAWIEYHNVSKCKRCIAKEEGKSVNEKYGKPRIKIDKKKCKKIRAYAELGQTDEHMALQFEVSEKTIQMHRLGKCHHDL